MRDAVASPVVRCFAPVSCAPCAPPLPLATSNRRMSIADQNALRSQTTICANALRFVATEKLNLKNLTCKAKSKCKRQKTGLNRNLLDAGIDNLKSLIIPMPHCDRASMVLTATCSVLPERLWTTYLLKSKHSSITLVCKTPKVSPPDFKLCSISNSMGRVAKSCFGLVRCISLLIK